MNDKKFLKFLHCVSHNIVVWKNEKKSHQKKKFGQINYLLSYFFTQCGNYGNLLSRFFGKNFVEATHLLNKSLKSWYDGKNFGESKFFIFSTMCFSNTLLSRNFCQTKNVLDQNHRNFHTMVRSSIIHCKGTF